jgi:hypothetical protein
MVWVWRVQPSKFAPTLIREQIKFLIMKWIDYNKQKPEKECHCIVYGAGFYKNYRGVIAEWDNQHKMFYGEANEEPLYDVKYWAELPELSKNFIPQNTAKPSSENDVCAIPHVSQRSELLAFKRFISKTPLAELELYSDEEFTDLYIKANCG